MGIHMKISTEYKRVYITIKGNFAILCIVFITIFFIIDLILGGILEYYDNFDSPDIHSLMWKDFYSHAPDTIDVMFLGSSHAKFAFNTEFYNEKLNINTFNLSSSEQTPLVGYYSLKEALKYQKPELLVYEAYWREFGINDNTTSAYAVYGYMKGQDSNITLLASISKDENFPSFLLQAICKTYKYREAFFPALKHILKGELKKNYTSYHKNQYSDFIYVSDGYNVSDKVVSSEKLFNSNPFKKAGLNFKWNDIQIRYFKKTMTLCKENNIKVLIVTAPLPKPTMGFVKNYEQYSNKILSIANDFGIKYIDYNSLDYRDIFEDHFFFDSNHLNSEGTKMINDLLLPEINSCLN